MTAREILTSEMMNHVSIQQVACETGKYIS
ncbi:hypothetical protein CBM2606_A10139 [Cupriavidus taiwanensis]|nr:hypothetical protein CBM2606_A10139 [Cupriavidus taiwanensis]